MAAGRKRSPAGPAPDRRRRSLPRAADPQALDQARMLQLFGQTVERANDGVVMTDLEGVITYANTACERMSGWPRAELVGQSTDVFIADTRSYGAARLMGVVKSGGAWRGEVEYVKKSGERIFVDLAVFPVLGERGKVQSTISIQRDVTPRRRLLLELEASEARYRQLFDAASDMILLLDERGSLLRVNAATAQALGQPGEQLIGHRLQEFVPEEQRPLLEALIKKLRGGERSVFTELTLVAGARQLRVEANLSTRREPGAFEGLVAVFRDVTERQRLMHAVQASARLRDLGRFASTVAHEIRNPLSTLKIAVQALERSGAPLDEKDRRRLTIAAREISTMERTLNEILDYAGPGQPVLAPHDLRPLVLEAIEVVEAEAKDSGVTLTMHEQPLGPALLDPARARQALVNVCLNAAQAMASGGQVDVELGPAPAGGAMVRVLDRGPGVPADLKAHIFEPFVTSRARGTGLGLAVVKKVMDENGGTVEVSDREGGGAVFSLYFQGAP